MAMQPVDPSLARAGSASPAAAGDPIVLEPRVRLSALAVGSEVNARMLSERAGGRFVAVVQGRQVEIALPVGARAGETVKLVVLADQPRLLLAARGDPGASSAGATLGRELTGLQRMGEDRAGAAAPAGAGRREVSLSAAGQSLHRLLAEIGSQAERGSGRAAGATASAPLIGAPPAPSAALASQIAAALARTLSASGLFYEAHQAQWVAGERSLAALKAEPQGRLAPLLFAMPATVDAEAAAARGTGAVGAAAAESPRSPGSSAAPAGAPARWHDAAIDPEIASLVHQQIQALDARAASWAGQVLPGMQLALTVHERTGEPDADDAAAPAGDWATQLAVMLPRLGQIEVRLTLRGDRLALSVSAGDALTVDRLSTAGDGLAGALDAVGLRIDSLRVAQRAAADE